MKLALKFNSASVIFAHNHPSGVAAPSRADELLTTSLKQAPALVDIKFLDHIIVAGATGISFAEKRPPMKTTATSSQLRNFERRIGEAIRLSAGPAS